MTASNGKPKVWKIALLRISNVLGISSAEIRPGSLTIAEGGNEQGKTSLIEAALAGLVGGGNPARLLKQGADEGSIVYLLDDGSGPPLLEVKTTIKADKVSKTMRVQGEPAMNRGAELLDGIRNKASMLPVTLLVGKPAERVETLLSAIPLKVQRADLAGVLEFCDNLKSIDLSRHAFLVLNEIEHNLRTKRTGVNAIVTRNRKGALAMKEALPANSMDGNTADQALAILRGELDDFRKRYETDLSALKQRMQESKDRAKRIYDDAVDAARIEMDHRIQVAAEDFEAHKAELDGSRIDSEARLMEGVSKAQASMDNYRASEKTRDMITSMSEEADANEQLSSELTDAIDIQLTDIRASLLEQVPIKGVTIIDGDICVKNKDGLDVPWDGCNTATRLRVAVDLALLNSGPLKWVCLDNAESLDEENLNHLREILIERGAQCFATRVTAGPLTISTR